MIDIPHNSPTLDKEELSASERVLNSNWLSQGNETQNFENEFCEFLGLPEGHAVAVSSGTAALYLSIWVLNGKDKNIALPTYACTALYNSIKMNSAIPYFIDTEIDSPNIDINQLNKSNCDLAIIPHTYGFPVDLNKIKIPFIIEDCCQSLGSYYQNTHTGLFGDISVFSFYVSKIITSGGQGGMIVSKNKYLIDKIKDYRDFDMKTDMIGRFNFQMTEIQAAIGRVQLSKLPIFLNRRKEIYSLYKESGLELESSHENSTQNNYRVIVKTNQPLNFIKKLESNNIKSIIPIQEKELLIPSPNSVSYSNNTISLPIYPKLTNTQITKIINTLI